MEKIKIDLDLLREPNELSLRSTHCDVYFNDEIEEFLFNRLHRFGLCLKVFDKLPVEGGKYMWGKTTLDEASKIQNIFSWFDIAPRVFENVILPDGRGAQITKFVHRESGDPDLELANELVNFYNIKHRKFDIFNIISNIGQTWVGKYMVDFGGFTFAGDYLKQLRKRAYTRRGEIRDGAYQSESLLEIAGSRDIHKRAEWMFLEGSVFENKEVLDIGCDLGGMSRFASQAGAWRVWGVDRREKPILAHEISNWLGFWNIDYINAPLPDNRDKVLTVAGRGKFDVVLCLAVVNHLKGGYQKYISDFVKPGGLMYFEGHGKKDVVNYTDEIEEMLRPDFAEVRFIGLSDDNYVRPVFMCRKGYEE